MPMTTNVGIRGWNNYGARMIEPVVRILSVNVACSKPDRSFDHNSWSVQVPSNMLLSARKERRPLTEVVNNCTVGHVITLDVDNVTHLTQFAGQLATQLKQAKGSMEHRNFVKK